MKRFLYNYFGYNKKEIENNSAIIIQRAYRNYINYKKNILSDYIKYYSIFNSKKKSDKELDKECYEDMNYWKNMRILIKTKILRNYIII